MMIGAAVRNCKPLDSDPPRREKTLNRREAETQRQKEDEALSYLAGGFSLAWMPIQSTVMQKQRGQFIATVAANVPLCREHFRLVLRMADFPPTDPGQFVQVACRALDGSCSDPVEYDWSPGQLPTSHGIELASPLAMLRRPFSLAGRRDVDGVAEVDLIHRVVGTGTEWLSHLKPGDSVFVLGPLGNRFELPPADGVALLVGGGVGIPPMMYLAERLEGRKAVVFAGALSRTLLPLTVTDDAPPPTAYDVDPLYNIAEFSRFGIPAVIATDDGSYGFRGFVTQALQAYLARWFTGNSSAIIYTCGPEPMMKRVAELAANFRLPCQIAVERAMACGMGTCQSCCIKVKKPDPALPPMPGQDWAYRLACTDGPVFAAKDLLW
jgi:dihydroorotate dehydrogenase electron transfer subunit